MVQTDTAHRAAGKAGIGCLILFLLPFCAVGVGTGVGAVISLMNGDLLQAGFLTIFALVFGGVGFGMIGAGILGHKRLREGTRLQAEHPNEPWKWNPDWLSGRLESSGRASMITAGAFAAFWNLIALPGAVLALAEWRTTGDPMLLIVLLFPAVGVGLLVWAVREAIRFRKFGVTQFEMAHVPGVIGRGMGGLLRTTREMRPSNGFVVTLVCVNRVVTGSGKQRNTREKTLWHEETVIRDYRRDPDGVGTMVPIAFRIPADARQTDDADPRNRIVWRLKVTADVPGVDYAATFEIPVYRTAESATPAPDAREEERLVEAAAADPAHQPPDSRIVVRTLAGRTEIYYPPGRHPGPAMGLTIFFLVWTAVVWFLLGSDAPLLFPIVFGFFDVLIGLAVLQLWFGVTRIVLRSNAVEVRRGLVFWQGTTTTIPANEVEDVRLKVGMQAGDRPYYDLWIVRPNGKKVKAGSSVRNKREAEWLAALIKAG